jgi:hypothetical protein
LVAVLVPEETTLFVLAKEKNLELDMKTLCRNSEIKKHILAELNSIGKKGDLKGFEQVRAFIFI